jgi:hypothetical protein
VSASRLHDRCGPFSCAGLKLSKNCALPFSLRINPSFFEEADCKGTTFLETGNQKIQLFLIIYCIILKVRCIKIAKSIK